tara:strand:- start:15898 stop:16965 length:1068 start_codon:yes stop_codon:yes gene_type:complete
MGGMCTAQTEIIPTETDVLEGTEIPEWVSKGGQLLFAEAVNLADQPLQTFDGARLPVYGRLGDDGKAAELTYETVTDPDTGMTSQRLTNPADQLSKLTPTEQQAVQKLMNEGGDWRGYIEGKTGVRGTEGLLSDFTQNIGQLQPQAFGQADLDKYMPTFMSSVDPALEDVSQTFNRARQDASAIYGGGAFGNARMGVEQAELTRNEARERGRILADAGVRGLEFSAAQAERDKARDERIFDLTQTARLTGARAYQDVAPLVQSLSEQEAVGLLGAGEAERTLDTQALELAYRDFVEQREYPFSSLNFAIGALKGIPYETREFAMQRGGEVIQSPSVYGQTIGGLGSLYSAYKMLQ